MTIAAFSQFSGINAVLYYLNDIFSAAGASATSGGIQAVAVGATNLVFTTLAMLTIDKFGRRVWISGNGRDAGGYRRYFLPIHTVSCLYGS